MQALMIDMTQLLPGLAGAQAQGKGVNNDNFAKLLQALAGAGEHNEELFSALAAEDQALGAQPAELFTPQPTLIPAQVAEMARELPAQGPRYENLPQGTSAPQVQADVSPGEGRAAFAVEQHPGFVSLRQPDSGLPQAQPSFGAQGGAQNPWGETSRQELTPQPEAVPVDPKAHAQALRPGAQASGAATDSAVMAARMQAVVPEQMGKAAVEPGVDRGVSPESQGAPAPSLRRDEPGQMLRDTMDARFAALLGPRALHGESLRPSEGGRLDAVLVQEPGAGEESSRIAGLASRQGQSDAGTLLHRNPAAEVALPSPGAAAEPSTTFAVDTARSAPVTPEAAAPQTVKLPSGAQVPEQQILNQVMERLQVRNAGERSVMTLRLNPQELGELRMELVMEKGVLKAQVLAQTPQVQEVLERNLHRLREALEGQGVKIDSFEVGLDDGRRNGGHQAFDQRPAAEFAQPRTSARSLAALEKESPEPSAAAPAGGGINLRI